MAADSDTTALGTPLTGCAPFLGANDFFSVGLGKHRGRKPGSHK
jgi:hypothetical protein